MPKISEDVAVLRDRSDREQVMDYGLDTKQFRLHVVRPILQRIHSYRFNEAAATPRARSL